mgnify:CR=1 FL=1
MAEYIKALEEVCEGLEEAYGVDSSPNSSDIGIKMVLESVGKKYNKEDKKAILGLHAQAFPHISLLAHLSGRMDFFEYSRLDFRGYPHTSRLEDALSYFVSRKKLSSDTVSYADFVVSLLDLIDKKHLNLRYELPYRFLRMFVVMVMYGNFAEASILANFIIKQIRRSD